MGTGFPGGAMVKNPPADAKYISSIPGLGGFPGEGNSNPLQPGKSQGQRSLVCTLHGVTKNQT